MDAPHELLLALTNGGIVNNDTKAMCGVCHVFRDHSYTLVDRASMTLIPVDMLQHAKFHKRVSNPGMRLEIQCDTDTDDLPAEIYAAAMDNHILVREIALSVDASAGSDELASIGTAMEPIMCATSGLQTFDLTVTVSSQTVFEPLTIWPGLMCSADTIRIMHLGCINYTDANVGAICGFRNLVELQVDLAMSDGQAVQSFLWMPDHTDRLMQSLEHLEVLHAAVSLHDGVCFPKVHTVGGTFTNGCVGQVLTAFPALRTLDEKVFFDDRISLGALRGIAHIAATEHKCSNYIPWVEDDTFDSEMESVLDSLRRSTGYRVDHMTTRWSNNPAQFLVAEMIDALLTGSPVNVRCSVVITWMDDPDIDAIIAVAKRHAVPELHLQISFMDEAEAKALASAKVDCGLRAFTVSGAA